MATIQEKLANKTQTEKVAIKSVEIKLALQPGKYKRYA